MTNNTRSSRSSPSPESQECLSNSQHTHLSTLVSAARSHIRSIDQQTDGLTAAIVGGAPRDALLCRSWNDLDFVAIGESRDSLEARGFKDANSSSFGVYFDSNYDEWALPRQDTSTGSGYRDFNSTFNTSIRTDLRRRDLRLNAIAILLDGTVPEGFASHETIQLTVNGKSATLLDPFGGIKDINRSVLHHINKSFAEDPLRVLRVARYTAELTGFDDSQFSVSPNTEQLMQSVAPQLNRMSRDRIGKEILKAMRRASYPTRFWTTLRDTGALSCLFPTLDRASIVKPGADKYHLEEDTFAHTMLTLYQMKIICDKRDCRPVDQSRRYLLAVAHDLGKVAIADRRGGLHSDDPPTKFGGHDDSTLAAPLRDIRRLGLPDHIVQTILDGIELHMDIHDTPTWSPHRLLTFVNNHSYPQAAETPHGATVEELIDLAHADHQGRFIPASEANNKQAVKEKLPKHIKEFIPSTDADSRVIPKFNRDSIEKPWKVAQTALNTIDGETILQEGLCSKHRTDDLRGDELKRTVTDCTECRSPGPWVGEQLTEERAKEVQDTLTNTPQ
jgi:tRNA nucleotidyltransferase (CCA-adding enzyme)